MSDIAILSPDPEMCRMYQLGFELDGFSVETAIDPSEIDWDASPTAILIDVVHDSPDIWNIVRTTQKKAQRRRDTSVAVILPRGRKTLGMPKGTAADLIVKRPFDFLFLIRSVGQMARQKGEGMAAKKRSPSKPSKKTARPKTPSKNTKAKRKPRR